MNQEKARDFFSAYYEGSLDRGLRQQFEARLASDANLKSDYAAFAETMEALSCFSDEEIEIPIFLDDRIATRLEAEEARRARRTPAFLGWLRYGAMTGLAAVAIFASIFAFRGGSKVATAGLVPDGATAESPDHLQFIGDQHEVKLRFTGNEVKMVTVSSATTGHVVKRLATDHLTTETALRNSNPHAAVFSVAAGGEAGEKALVALPGTAHAKQDSGSGSLTVFAAAVADRYGVPVVIRGNTAGEVTWTFEPGTALHNVETALQSQKASVDQRDGGMISVLID